MAEIWTRAARQRQPTGASLLAPEWTSRGLIRSAQPWAGFDGLRPFSTNTTSRFSASPGVALNVDGGTKYADINATGHGVTNKVTVCALVQVNAVNYYPMILSAASGNGDTLEGFELRLFDNTGRPQFSIDDSTARPSAGISQNIIGTGIRFVAGRYNGSSINVFLDDTKSSDVAASGNIEGINNTWRIGNRPTGGYPFTGYVYGLHIFASALTDQDIQSLRRNMWQVFAPERRVSYNFPSGTIKTVLKTRARTTQPIGLSQVNWANPITRDLVALTNASKRYEAVKGILATTEAIFETQAVKAKYTNEVGRLYNRFTTASKDTWPVKGTTGDLTFLMYGQLLSTTAAGQDLCSLTTVGNTTVIGFRESSNNQMTLHIRLSNVLEVMLPLGNQTGKSEIFICRITGTTLRVWRDGKQVGSDIALSGNNFSDIVSLVNGSTKWGEPPYGIIHTSAYWTRALNDAEVAEVTRNPWLLFAPETARTFMPQAAAVTPSTAVVPRFNRADKIRTTQPVGRVTVNQNVGLSGAWLYSSNSAKEQIYDLVCGLQYRATDNNNIFLPNTYNGLLAGKNSNGTGGTPLGYGTIYTTGGSPLGNASQFSLLAFFIFDPNSFASAHYLHWRQEFHHSIDVFSYTSNSISWGTDWAGAWNAANQQTLSGLSPGQVVCIGSSITQSGARLFHNGRFSGIKPGGGFAPLANSNVQIVSGSRMPQLGGFAFRRALTDAEMVSYTANPWQLFAPERKVIYSLPSTAKTPRINYVDKRRTTQPSGSILLSTKYADAVAVAAPWLGTENQVSPGSKWTSWGTAPVRGSGSGGVSVDTNFSGWQITPKKNPGETTQTHIIVAEVSAYTQNYAGLFCVHQSGTQAVTSFQLSGNTKWSVWTNNVTPVAEIDTAALPVLFSKRTIVVNRTQNRVKVYVEGVKVLDAATSDSGYSNSSIVLAGERGATNIYAIKSKIYLYAGFTRAFPDDELRSLSQNPWQLFAPDHQVIYSLPSTQRRRIMLIS